jgi:hypothetical protein
MSNAAAALAELGLGDLGIVETEIKRAEVVVPEGGPAPELTAVQTEANGDAEKKTRTQVTIGEVTAGAAVGLPDIRRAGGFGERGERESKYDFIEEIAAPEDAGNGAFKYAFKHVAFVAGEDQKAMKRALSSAVTAANNKGKEKGRYYAARTAYASDAEDAPETGVNIYRIDNTLGNLNEK